MYHNYILGIAIIADIIIGMVLIHNLNKIKRNNHDNETFIEI